VGERGIGGMGNRGWEGKREKGNGGWEVGVEVEEKGRREREVGVDGKVKRGLLKTFYFGQLLVFLENVNR
jgi:hypothetical protein